MLGGDQDEEEELVNQLEELQRENDSLARENDLFSSYFRRHEETKKEEEESTKKAGGRQRRQRRNVPATLTMEQRYEVANAELEEVQGEIENTKKSSEKLVDTLRAVLEETDVRIAELKKDAYEFKRDIVVGAENFRTGKTMAEKVVRYMEEKLRQKDAIIEKLRLKNATLKSQTQKVEAQLRQKEEMGDVLHYIDFHQLQIENKQYVAKIEERNDELLKLKMTTGNTVQVLNNLKRRLNGLISESAWLNREIQARTELLAKVQDDNATVDGEIARERRVRKHLSQQQSDNSNMPQVLDYVGQKAEMYELQDAVTNWERKVEIMEMAAKRARILARQRRRDGSMESAGQAGSFGMSQEMMGGTQPNLGLG